MGTKARWINGNLVFHSNAMHVSTGGNILTNQRLHTSVTKTDMLEDTVYANTLNSTSTGFRVVVGGEISAFTAHDVTLTLMYGATDILALPTVTLVAENDKPWKAEFTGHVLTTGSSGFILASGIMWVGQTTPMTFMADTANTGTSVDLTADGDITIAAKWDTSSADSDIIFTHGWVEYFR